MKNWSFAQLGLRFASCEPSCERILRLDLSLLFCLQKNFFFFYFFLFIFFYYYAAPINNNAHGVPICDNLNVLVNNFQILKTKNKTDGALQL